MPTKHYQDAHEKLDAIRIFPNSDVSFQEVYDLHSQITFDNWMYFGYGIIAGGLIGIIQILWL